MTPNLTTPYDYYQYWVNAADADVVRFLSLFTFLPMGEINEVKNLQEARLNMAKAVLAYEATRISHGEEAAVGAWKSSASAFNLKPADKDILPSSTIPRELCALDDSAISRISKTVAELEDGIAAYELFFEARLCGSKGEARRVITQGGGYINDRQIQSFDEKISLADFGMNSTVYLRKGKKTFAVLKKDQ